MATTEPVQKYFDALLATYDILTEAAAKSSERGLKLTRQFATDVAASQREALEAARTLAAHPSDFSQLSAALLQAATAAQGRALAFAQANYQEALVASVEARETLEKLTAANKETAEAALSAARAWSAANPLADAVRRGFEAFAPAKGA